MTPRRILRIQGDDVSVASESRFESEERLQGAIAAHPEVLPADDFGLGQLVTLGVELDFGAGPMDLLAVDATGRLVIAEFKRGSENPDVRKVIAQVLDYGSALWRTPYERLSDACRRGSAFPESLVDHVQAELLERGDEVFDPDAFRQGVDSCLDSGSFVFLYIGRDLDQRTRRIMTYLAEGPRMSFFAVEVDYYVAGQDETRVLVPRTAFVPSWVTQPTFLTRTTTASSSAARLASASAETVQLWQHMGQLADELGLETVTRPSGYLYRAPGSDYGVGVYATSRGAEFDLKGVRDRGEAEWADNFVRNLSDFAGRTSSAPNFPTLSAEALEVGWSDARAKLLQPFFQKQRSLVPLATS